MDERNWMPSVRSGTPEFWWKTARYSIFVIAVVAAIITPTPSEKTVLGIIALVVGLFFVALAVPKA